jgi:hypothetical protein
MSSISPKTITWLDKSQISPDEPPSTTNDLFEIWEPRDSSLHSEVIASKRIATKQKTSWPAARFSNISISDYYFDEIIDELNRANSYYEPKEASEHIEKIWAKIDELSSLAESRLRIKIAAINKPKLSKVIPSDILESLEKLKNAPEAAIPALQVIDLVSKLLRALPLELLNTFDIDINWLGIGALEVKLNSDLTWLVYPVRISWPAVKVKTIAGRALDKSPDTKTFFTAHSVIEYSLNILTNVKR